MLTNNGINVLKLDTPIDLAQDYQKKKLQMADSNMRNSKIESMMLKTTSQQWKLGYDVKGITGQSFNYITPQKTAVALRPKPELTKSVKIHTVTQSFGMNDSSKFAGEDSQCGV